MSKEEPECRQMDGESFFLPSYFVHICPTFVPKSPTLSYFEQVVSRELQGSTHLLSIPSINFSFSLSLFSHPHNSHSQMSFTSTQPVVLFCPAKVSSSLSPSFRLGPISFCPPSVHFLFLLCLHVFSPLFLCLVPGLHPEYQLQPLQHYLVSSLPSGGSLFCNERWSGKKKQSS